MCPPEPPPCLGGLNYERKTEFDDRAVSRAPSLNVYEKELFRAVVNV